MKLTIGVMGSSGGDLTDEIKLRAFRLGQVIAEPGGCVDHRGLSRSAV